MLDSIEYHSGPLLLSMRRREIERPFIRSFNGRFSSLDNSFAALRVPLVDPIVQVSSTVNSPNDLDSKKKSWCWNHRWTVGESMWSVESFIPIL